MELTEVALPAVMSNLSNAFIAETAPRHLRGSLGAFFQFFLVIGG